MFERTIWKTNTSSKSQQLVTKYDQVHKTGEKGKQMQLGILPDYYKSLFSMFLPQVHSGRILAGVMNIYLKT